MEATVAVPYEGDRHTGKSRGHVGDNGPQNFGRYLDRLEVFIPDNQPFFADAKFFGRLPFLIQRPRLKLVVDGLIHLYDQVSQRPHQSGGPILADRPQFQNPQFHPDTLSFYRLSGSSSVYRQQIVRS